MSPAPVPLYRSGDRGPNDPVFIMVLEDPHMDNEYLVTHLADILNRSEEWAQSKVWEIHENLRAIVYEGPYEPVEHYCKLLLRAQIAALPV